MRSFYLKCRPQAPALTAGDVVLIPILQMSFIILTCMTAQGAMAADYILTGLNPREKCSKGALF